VVFPPDTTRCPGWWERGRRVVVAHHRRPGPTRDGCRVTSAALGVDRGAGDYSTAALGPLWVDVTSLCWFNGWVVADAGARAQGV